MHGLYVPEKVRLQLEKLLDSILLRLLHRCIEQKYTILQRMDGWKNKIPSQAC